MENIGSAALLRGRIRRIKDLVFICFGIVLYSFGYTAFVLPEQVVMGGVAGISALLYYAFGIPTGAMILASNAVMLLVAYRAINRRFVVRTVVGVVILSALISVMQPVFEAYPVITAGDDRFMHVLIGGALAGSGLGIVFSHNGSTGGTDIIVALLNKYYRMSFGRAMQLLDIAVILSSYLLFHSVETIVYGVAFVLIASYVCDYVINGTRQTVQFIIISKHYDAIADAVNSRVHRGATLIEGRGWYSKRSVQMLIVMARKYESQSLFNLIKSIDPEAMVSQTFCHGIFGEGFDSIK